MLSPHEIATLLLAAASLGPIDADALESPDLAALEQARLVHVAVYEGQTKVSVTEDGHRVLRRLGLERSGGERADAPRLTMAPAQRAGLDVDRELSTPESTSVSTSTSASTLALPQAASLPADASEHREEQA